MLEAPSSAGASQGGAADADFIRGDRERRERERESVYAPPPASNAPSSSNARGGERDYDQWRGGMFVNEGRDLGVRRGFGWA